MTKSELIVLFKATIAEETGIAASEISGGDTFANLGLDSVSCIFLMDKLEKKLNVELNPIHFWDYPTVDTYADFLLQEVIPHGK